ncbi:hypothetical protein Sjap_024483 [Stephania japonica]|uniref:VQ domain-containing protein n=1 Tax=Stephania japonica TaxID=461633 RepID=A0AAP0HP05_9MAGN
MIPSRFHKIDDQEGKMKSINVARPPPLNINNDSHAIYKPTAGRNEPSVSNHQSRRHPVIIYTHSPKVINIKPHDFMDVVQRLTGLSSSTHSSDVNHDMQPTCFFKGKKIGLCSAHGLSSGFAVDGAEAA